MKTETTLLEKLKDEKDKNFKQVINDIIGTSKDYLRTEPDWRKAVSQQLDAVDLLFYSSRLDEVARTSQIMFDGVNENKLSRLYGALGHYRRTGTLPSDYSEIKKLRAA